MLSEPADPSPDFGDDEGPEDGKVNPERDPDLNVRLNHFLSQAVKAVEEFRDRIVQRFVPMAAIYREGRNSRYIRQVYPGVHSSFFSGVRVPLEDAMPAGLDRERLKAIGTEIDDIVHEKGFRWNVTTANEHHGIGSTIWSGFDQEDPDVPTPILVKRLFDESRASDGLKAEDGLSIEEADRARRLEGRTTLDPLTGRVTNEVDEVVSHDPYHFLPPARRAELVLYEERLITEVAAIAERASAHHLMTFSVFLDALNAYAMGQISTASLQASLQNLKEGFDLKGDLAFFNPLKDLMQPLRLLVFATGRRDSILTPQEISLRDGVQIDSRYTARPYCPLATQDGTLSLEDVTAQRNAEQFMAANTSRLGYERVCALSLEPLGPSGETEKDPVFVNETNGQPMDVSWVEGGVHLPFAR